MKYTKFLPLFYFLSKIKKKKKKKKKKLTVSLEVRTPETENPNWGEIILFK